LRSHSPTPCIPFPYTTLFRSPQGTLILTLLDDGSLQGPMGTKLSKSSTETRTATASPDRGSSRLDGTYADEMGITSYKFESHGRDRKSTRLNSSHDQISYAVF